MGWKIAICDDDAGQAARLQADVTDWAHGACAVTCFPSAEAFRFAGDTDWDILLLDVEMPGMSGIDLAKRLRGAGCRAEIIFITSHFECMAEGYEVDALHYLVKPVPAEKLRAVLDRAAARLAVEPPSAVIACEEGNVKLYESELLYAESFLHDLVLHTTGPDYLGLCRAAERGLLPHAPVVPRQSEGRGAHRTHVRPAARRGGGPAGAGEV